jgi:hypothetical protein
LISFDPSKTTGWAVTDTRRDDSAIECDVFEMPDKADHYYTMDQIGLKTRNLIQGLVEAGRKPKFGVVEEQSLAKIGNTSADAMIYPWVASSAICSTLANFGIPYATIPAATWRVAFFGSGYKPPFKIIKLKKPDKKTGKMEKIEWLWKEAVVAECERRGIVLPSKKGLAHNAAEAAAIGMVGRCDKTKIHAKRYEAIWNEVKDSKYKKDRSSGDLFAESAA